MALSSSAPAAPSMTRWSAESVQAITVPTPTPSPSATGRRVAAPTPRMQLWGGLTMA